MDEDSADDPREIVLVTRPVPTPPPSPLEALTGVVSSSLGMVAATAGTVAAIVESAVTTSVGAALDRVVPAVVDAVIERIDLTDLVLTRVDLHRIVESALDTLDLTQVVLDRVDVDAIVDRADIDRVIDRVPIVPLANYVIEEIDLPQIIRESTGGVATDAVNSIRVQSVGADELVSRMADRFLLRRRQRKVDAPGEPESLLGRLADDATGSRPVDAVDDRADGAQVDEEGR